MFGSDSTKSQSPCDLTPRARPSKTLSGAKNSAQRSAQSERTGKGRGNW